MGVKEVAVDWSDLEPVLNDLRVNLVEGRIRFEFPLLSEDSDFVTFIQPERIVQGSDGVMQRVPPTAVFGLIGDNPRHPTFRVMTNATTPLVTWDEVEGEYRHFAGRPDPALNIFRYVAEQHIRTIENLREMI